jgi:hypothetical protein
MEEEKEAELFFCVGFPTVWSIEKPRYYTAWACTWWNRRGARSSFKPCL